MFRTTFSGGIVMMTASVDALPEMIRVNALIEVGRFDRFTFDNDPNCEHDFGSFEICGRTFFLKIDYYDTGMQFGSEDSSASDKIIRVLTIMLAEDY